MSTPPPILTTPPTGPLRLTTIAEMLGVSKMTLIREIHRGHLRATKARNRFEVDPTDLLLYLESRRPTPKTTQ